MKETIGYRQSDKDSCDNAGLNALEVLRKAADKFTEALEEVMSQFQEESDNDYTLSNTMEDIQEQIDNVSVDDIISEITEYIENRRWGVNDEV